MSIYLQRYAYPDQLIADQPSSNTNLSVVIPCYNEVDLLNSLRSLKACDLPPGVTEVIVIINEAENSPVRVRRQNRRTFEEVQKWLELNNGDRLRFYHHHLIFPPKNAGVGMARKAGMDEAARRFEKINRPDGIICCFDADSTCDKNYLLEVYSMFFNSPLKPIGATIYYEHPIEESMGRLASGIQQYELHLRYYVNSLRYAGFPYAFQTIGSCMAVRSDAYQKHGGMNKRKAGEDFYFLQKIIPLGSFVEINTTRVIPSPRVSDRVPFGTGRAMAEWMQADKTMLDTYNFAGFRDLRVFFKHITSFYQASDARIKAIATMLPESLQAFMPDEELAVKIVEINRQSTSESTFRHRFYLWFNGFKVLKFIHFARDHFYENEPVMTCAAQLSETYFGIKSNTGRVKELLQIFRKHDRGFRAERISLRHQSSA
jgi:glycosyltransferase involved in cell wall biosynthesis